MRCESRPSSKGGTHFFFVYHKGWTKERGNAWAKELASEKRYKTMI